MAPEYARAVIFAAPGTVEVRRTEVRPGPGEVLIRASVCGISHGTEMLFFNGPFPAGSEMERLAGIAASDYPVTYGYMTVGTTNAGKRVFAFAPHQSRIAVPAEALIPLPDSLADDDAVLFPSVETALQIVHDAAPRLGETVMVLGLGVIGTLVSMLLLRTGVTVLCGDPVEARRRRLEAMDFVTFDPTAEPARTWIAEENGGGPDIAINTSANPQALQFAVDTLRPEGVVVEASWYGSRQANLSLGGAFHRRRLTMRASQVSHLNPAMRPRWTRERRTESVLRLLGELAPSRLITHRFALDDAQAAYETIRNQPDDLLQAVLDV